MQQVEKKVMNTSSKEESERKEWENIYIVKQRSYNQQFQVLAFHRLDAVLYNDWIENGSIVREEGCEEGGWGG